MLRILQVVTDLSWPGGDHVYVCKLLEYLSDRHGAEFELHLAEIRAHARSENIHYYELMSALGVTVHSIQDGDWASMGFRMPSFISRLVNRLGIDIVHSHIFIADLSVVAAKLGSMRYIARLCESISPEKMSQAKRIIDSEVHQLNSIYEDILPVSKWKPENDLPPASFMHVSTKHLGVVKSICHEHDIERMYKEDAERRLIAHQVNRELQEFVSRESDQIVAIGLDAYDRWATINSRSLYIPVSIINDQDLKTAQLATRCREEGQHRWGVSAKKGTNFLFVGRLVHKKSPETLVAAFKAHLQLYPDDTLTVVGGGPLLGECLNISAGIPNIRFREHMHRDDVFSLMGALDALCLFSLEEGLPLVIQEAMASEMPILSSTAGGIGDLVEHGKSGFLIQAVTSDEILATLSRFSDLPSEVKRNFGRSARERLLAWNSADDGFCRYSELYKTLASEVSR